MFPDVPSKVARSTGLQMEAMPHLNSQPYDSENAVSENKALESLGDEVPGTGNLAEGARLKLRHANRLLATGGRVTPGARRSPRTRRPRSRSASCARPNRVQGSSRR